MSPLAFFALMREWERSERRKDERVALLASTFANCLGKKESGEAFSIQDFMPQRAPQNESPEEMNQKVIDVLKGLR